MVLPLAAIGAGIIGFVTFGKDLFGEKLFKQLLIGLSLLSIGIIGYFVYKWYETYKTAKDVVDNTVDNIKEYYEEKTGWLFNKKIPETKEILENVYNVTPDEVIPFLNKYTEKITPGSWEDIESRKDYKKTIMKDVPLIEQIYWMPTRIIKGTQDNVTTFASNPVKYIKKIKLW